MAVLEWKKRTRGVLSLVRRGASGKRTTGEAGEGNQETPKPTPSAATGAGDLPGAVFYYPGSCAAAAKAFRKKAREHGLRIPFEFNVADYIEDELGIGLRPCRVVCVVCPFLLLQAAVWDGSGASFLPVRVVFSGRGEETQIRVVGPFDPLLPNGLRTPFQRFLEALGAVLDEMGAVRSGPRPCA